MIFHSFIHNTFICTSFHHKEKNPAIIWLHAANGVDNQTHKTYVVIRVNITQYAGSGLQTGSREIIHIHIIKNMKNDTESVIFNPVKICKICKNTKMVQGNVEVSQTDLGLLFC